MADQKRMEVVSWILKVQEQSKTAKGNVNIKAFVPGRKRPEGGYDNGLFLTVMVLDGKCEWIPGDYEGKYIEVDGQFSHTDWEANGKHGKNFTIWASAVREYTFDKEENTGKGKSKGKSKY